MKATTQLADRSDDELLAGWRDGDNADGDAFFMRHFDALYRFFERKAALDVEDLIQRTFMSCVEARDRFRGDASFRTFLFAIARHQLMSDWRRRKRDSDIDFSVTSLQDLGPSPSRELGDKQDRRLLLAGLRRIPLDLQIAIELSYWEGLTGPEVATVLEIPEGTVRSRLRRARAALAKALAEIGASEAAVATTLSDLEGWAASLSGSAR